MRRLLILGIRAYQRVVSPALGANCRFHPSCSEYAAQAIERFGVIRGGWLAVRRLGRCHPWNPGGVDHVPGRRPAASSLAPDAAPAPSLYPPGVPREDRP